MLFKTAGIVLNYIKFRETSIIVKIYTEEFGLQTYIENGVRSTKSKGKIALFQPLTVLDLVVYNKNGKDIQRISELKCTRPFFSIATDIKKSTLGIFVSEILNLSLKEHTENAHLFEFLVDSLEFLENHEDQIENFHLYFLIGLSNYLGFGPESVQDIKLQLLEYGKVMAKENEAVIQKVIQGPFGRNLDISKSLRMECLEVLIDFYRLNLDNFSGMKSLPILKEILD